MTDIATLGLAIDSRPAATAAAALDKLTASAAPAAAGVANLLKAAAGTSGILTTATKATDSHSESLRGQRMALRAVGEDIALLSPQFGSLAGTAGMLYIANAHLFQGFDGLKSAISSLLTPTNLMLGAFVAAAAGSYLVYQSIKTTELQFGDLSERIGSSVESLHAFESAASFKGIDTSDFLKSMEKFGDLSTQARDNLGSMAELFKVNGVAAGTLDDNLLNAADLIRNAATEQAKYQIIQQLGLPATREWVQYLSQGSAGLQQAAKDAAQFGSAADRMLIAKAREFDEAWAKTWKNFVTSGKSAFVSLLSGIDSLGDTITNGLISAGVNVGANLLKAGKGSQMSQSDANAFYDATGAGRAPIDPTTDPAIIKAKIAATQPRIAIVGTLAPIAQASIEPKPAQPDRKAA